MIDKSFVDNQNIINELRYLQYKFFINYKLKAKIKFKKDYNVISIESFNKKNNFYKVFYIFKLIPKKFKFLKFIIKLPFLLFQTNKIDIDITSYPEVDFNLDLKIFLFLHFLKNEIKKIQILIARLLQNHFDSVIINNLIHLTLNNSVDNHQNNIDINILKKNKSDDFIIVIMTTSYSKILEASLRSLIDSDYSGKIILVENNKDYTCDSLISNFKKYDIDITLLNTGLNGGTSIAFNTATKYISNLNYKYVVFCHNDILWPKVWYQRSCEIINNNSQIGLFNFSYLQLNKLDPTLEYYFINNLYFEMKWSLEKIIDTGFYQHLYQDCRVLNNKDIGLGRDSWNDEINDLRFQVGRFSVASCLSKKILMKIYPFDEKLNFGPDNEIHDFCIKNKIWFAWINNMPLIHIRSYDTKRMTKLDHDLFGRKIIEMEKRFEDKYGWNIHHYHNILFSKCLVEYQDLIEDSLNNKDYKKINFFFDHFLNELKQRNNKNCNLIHCRSYNSCNYN